MWTDGSNIIADDAPYTDDQGRSYSGAWSKSDIPGLRHVVPSDRPDDRLHVVSGWRVQDLDGVSTQVWDSTPRPLSEVLTAYLAERRWRAETGGTTWNGWKLPTDERSQAKYAAEAQAVQISVRVDPSPWKLPHSFELLTNAQVIEMASAARVHVLACFALEASVAAQIGAGTVTSFAEIDAAFAAAFPQD